jgi:DNA polymerase (family 10)
MAEAAAERGYEHLSLNDHSKHVTVAHGLDEKRLRAQLEAIDSLNEKLDGLTLLKSAEVDILEDGSLDLRDDRGGSPRLRRLQRVASQPPTGLRL